MARSLSDIQQQIIAQVLADTTLGPLATNTSSTARWRLWTYVVASAIWLHELLFDSYRAEITNLIEQKKPHTLRWYRQKALDFQYGETLVDGADYYDNTAYTADEIEALKIVKHASTVEGSNGVIVKVAKSSAGVITPLTLDETTAITDYFQDIKDAGVVITIRSVAADAIRLQMDIYYNPQVLNSLGARLDGSASTPVQDAINLYLANLPFDGRLIQQHLIDAIQSVEGVHIPVATLCQARRSDDPTFTSVNVLYETYSGFIKIYSPSDLVLNFIAV